MAEKISIKHDLKSEDATCIQLAIEGQRLCRNGDIKTGIHFFENALMRGTDDLNILTVVYSQLGNAYFSLKEYSKSLHYHRLDLDLSRRLNDISGEAKACGNLGNTLKMLGNFDEAVACCQLHLKICRQLQDKPGIARALYNLANVYHQKAKSSGALGRQDLGQFPGYIQDALEKAAIYYEENLDISKELDDRATQGLSCGNLANTYYLLGNFQKAVELHTERLIIAKEFGHRAAERRAYSNRGNAYIFLANFEMAIEDYRCALHLARELNDETLEAQVCYSLGNTYYIMRRYDDASACLEQHLRIAKKLCDKVGEARAYWSLTNIHSDNGDYHRAKFYASLHLQIASELGDTLEITTARDNLAKLDVLIENNESAGGGPGAANNNNVTNDVTSNSITNHKSAVTSNNHKSTMGASGDSNRRNDNANSLVVHVKHGTQNNNFSIPSQKSSSAGLNRQVGGSLKIAGGGTSGGGSITKSSSQGNMAIGGTSGTTNNNNNISSQGDQEEEEDEFFQRLSKFQSRRMDEQRCSIAQDEDQLPGEESNFLMRHDEDDDGMVMSEAQTEFLELVAGVQGSRMNDQRAAVPPEFPGLRAGPEVLNRLMEAEDLIEGGPSEALLEMIARCQASRIDDQRSSLPPPTITPSALGETSVSSSNAGETVARPSTVPDEDLMALIQRLSSYRLDEQRCSPPFPLPALTLVGPPPLPNRSHQQPTHNLLTIVDDADGIPEPTSANSSCRGSRRRR